jgi:transcriptional regulator with XRE-family HTH domain
MAKPRPGAKAKSLGAALREIRKDRGLSLAAVSAELVWSESKLSRLETGQRNVESEEVSALLAVYKVVGAERDELVAMARTPDQPGWLQAAASGTTTDAVALATYEAGADQVISWSPILIPGRWQTMEYGRAHMLADGIPEKQVGSRLMARKRRQEQLAAIDYQAYIWEPALRNPVGGDMAMAQQLRSLLDAIDNGAYLRILPGNVGAHPALVSAFLLIKIPDRPTVVHIELSRSAVFLSDPSDVDHYARVVARLSDSALDASQSRRLIDDIARGGGSS